MEPATSIIKRLGGTIAVADALNIHRTRVYAWQRSKDGGGTDGRVPHWHIPALIALSERLGKPLSFSDFAWSPPVRPVVRKPAPQPERAA